MNDSAWDFLYEVDCIEVEETKERFLNDVNFFSDCVSRSLKDPSFQELKTLLENKEVKRAFEVSHTLKGVTANCGLSSLYNILVKIVEPLRAGEIDGLLSYYALLEKELERVQQISKNYFSK